MSPETKSPCNNDTDNPDYGTAKKLEPKTTVIRRNVSWMKGGVVNFLNVKIPIEIVVQTSQRDDHNRGDEVDGPCVHPEGM